MDMDVDEKVEYCGTEEYVITTTTESVSQVSVSSHDQRIFYSPPLESKVSFSANTKQEKSLFTSTPNFITNDNNEGCQDDHGNDDKNLRVRRKECHRVHYSSDLDESNLTSYEEKKRNKRRRLSLLQSVSTDEIDSEEVYLDTLENHLFPDMSFSESELSYSESKFSSTTNKTDLSWSKLQGVSYSSKYDFSGDELDVNRSINHLKRSIFRQKRRDWYLNRRSGQRNIIHTGLWRSLRQFIQILIISSLMNKVSRKITRYVRTVCHGVSRSSYNVFRYVSKPILLVFKIVLYIYSFIKRKVISVYSKVLCLFITSSKNDVAEKAKRKLACSYFFCWILLLLAILAALFAGYSEEGDLQNAIIPIPNPHKSGIANAYPVYIDAEHSRIPAWHIYPNLLASSVIHPVKKSLKDRSPVILYLRHEGAPDAPKLKSIYQTLSSLGYHIVVLTNMPSQYEVLKSWKWIKVQTNATAYLWGYGMSAASLTVTAKLFCKDLLPPNGVIIARQTENGNLHHNMEIWSCNCALTTSGNTNGTDFKYNHVKCPVAFNNNVNDIYSQVVACIETVNKGAK